jgi:hypothetical protein
MVAVEVVELEHDQTAEHLTSQISNFVHRRTFLRCHLYHWDIFWDAIVAIVAAILAPRFT